MCVCVLDSSVILALFLSVMLILWLCGESSCPGACDSEVDQESKSICVCACLCRASLVKCEWLVDPNGG